MHNSIERGSFLHAADHEATAPLAAARPSRRFRAFALAVLATLLLPALAVAGDLPSRESPGTPDDADLTLASAPTIPGSQYRPSLIGVTRDRQAQRQSLSAPGVPAVDCPTCDPQAPYEPSSFNHPIKNQNGWFPLQPGKQLVYRGVANRGGGLLPHEVIFTVTDLVKVIGGIPCIVVWDQDINEGVLSESELAFFAQHDNGDVYLAGEYPEEYWQGQFVDAENTWIHGVEWARAGVNTPAQPDVGGPGWEQANAPENDFWDCGKAMSIVKERTCVPAGCFKDILTIHEWAPWDGCDVIQIKTYAKGIGVIQVGALDDPEGETLVLTQMRQLNAEEMEDAREAAIALDTHGPFVNEIYATTQPVQRARSVHQVDLPVNGMADGTMASSPMFLSIGRNPVRDGTTIAYGIGQEGVVQVDVFDIVGRKVRTLVNESKPSGAHQVQWDGRDGSGNRLGRGVYFARLRAGSQIVQRTLVLGH